MSDAAPMPSQPDRDAPAAGGRALVVTVPATGEPLASHLGHAAYSYRHAYHAFRALLARYGTIIEIDRAESRLDAALAAARRQGLAPIHASFLPLQDLYPSTLAATVAFPFWEFPDLPDSDFDDNPRNNWARVSSALAGVACASQFTVDAFRRAGVRVPLHLVPPPVADEYFQVTPWPAVQRAGLDCHATVLGGRGESAGARPRQGATGRSRGAVRATFDRLVQPRLPLWLDRGLGELGRLGRGLVADARGDHPLPERRALALDGVVFTTVVNPFDERKNWVDLLTAFLIALRDAGDATLVLKLAVSPGLLASALRRVQATYDTTAPGHRCRVVLITGYLTPAEMVTLTEASTFFVAATRAEGACLPARDFLAAGRPVVAPAHSALADFVDGEVGWVVASHPEPTHWPHDSSRRLTTTWHRLVWQSLHDQIGAAYRTATTDPERYARLAANGRARMLTLAGSTAVWPRLRAALDHAADADAALR